VDTPGPDAPLLAEAGNRPHRHGKRSVDWVGPDRTLARIGSLRDDSPDEALKKQTLVLVACTITALSVVWVLTSLRST
jgi:hypothetical protein